MDRRKVLTWIGLGGLAAASPIIVDAAQESQLQTPSESEPNGLESVIFYVALNGKDTWSGKLGSPNSKKTDGPFATLEQARNAIRGIKRQHGGILKQPVIVFLRGGNYFLSEPLVFTPEDSGTANCPITYAAYQDEQPAISGGRLIIDWKPVTLDGKLLWATEIPKVRDGEWFFKELWVNGQRRIRARHPNQGYLKVPELPDVTPQTEWYQGQYRFKFNPGDLKAWKTISNAEAVVMTRWFESRLPITSVDEKERIISCSKSSGMRIDPGDLYYIENALEILDTPGEWYLDKNTGKLYYLPIQGEDIKKTEAIAPILSQLICLKGLPEKKQFVEHLIFRDLTFSHTQWYYSDDLFNRNSPQAAILVAAAIYMEGVRSCALDGCTIANMGTYAIELARSCQYTRVVECQIFDLGAGGIKIGESSLQQNDVDQTHSNEVTQCHIYNGGRLFHSAVGILIRQSYKNRISENHIHDFFYTGISIGWTWGYGSTLAKDNIVEFNHIHHIGLLSNGDGPLLNDKGAIYTLGVQPGTVIRSNKIHDIQAFNYGGWGIYLDEGSSQILVENNLVYRTRDGGFHQHYGKENIIRNNIFAFGTVAQIRRSAQEPHLSFTFERNIVYWNEGTLLFGNWADSNFLFNHNLYWQAGDKEIRFGDLSWKEWQTKGKDQNSMIADPLFIAPEQGDFRLNPNSPAFQLGFQPISLPKN